MVVTQNLSVWSEEHLVSTVSRARDLLAQTGDIDDVIAFAHADGMPFVQCLRLLTRLGVNLGAAKSLVHNSPAHGGTRQDREELWEVVDDAAMQFTQRPGLSDGVIRLRPWDDNDAAWYAECIRESEIQRFTTDPPSLDATQVLAAINRMRAADDAEGFVICDATNGARLGNIALSHDGSVGEVSYWVAAEARGRGAATRALILFTSWIFRELGLSELHLRTHQDNMASQRVAVRAGYRRDPGRDGPQEVKGVIWPMIAFSRRQ